MVVAALDPNSGKIWNNASFAVPTALLVELASEGRLAVSGAAKTARATVRDPAPLGDPEQPTSANQPPGKACRAPD